MFSLLYKKNKKNWIFQIKKKLIKKIFNNTNKLLNCIGIIDLLNIKKLKSIIILKYLLLLELIFGKKSFIKLYIIKYEHIKIQLFLKIRKNNYYYLFFLLKIFYLPMLLRQNIKLNKYSFDSQQNYFFNIKNMNFLPFMFNSYFLSTINIKIIYIFLTLKKNFIENKILLKYLL